MLVSLLVLYVLVASIKALILSNVVAKLVPLFHHATVILLSGVFQGGIHRRAGTRQNFEADLAAGLAEHSHLFVEENPHILI